MKGLLSHKISISNAPGALSERIISAFSASGSGSYLLRRSLTYLVPKRLQDPPTVRFSGDALCS